LLSCNCDLWTLFAFDKEVFEANAEDHRDTKQRRQRGKQLTALDLRQQRGR
jgi:hypothetical protein